MELIFVPNQEELEHNNSINKDLDFINRTDFDKNEDSPFGIALNVKVYNTKKIPFKKIIYHQDWIDKDAFIYAAKNSKIRLTEPSFFVVYPEIEAGKF